MTPQTKILALLSVALWWCHFACAEDTPIFRANHSINNISTVIRGEVFAVKSDNSTHHFITASGELIFTLNNFSRYSLVLNNIDHLVVHSSNEIAIYSFKEKRELWSVAQPNSKSKYFTIDKTIEGDGFLYVQRSISDGYTDLLKMHLSDGRLVETISNYRSIYRSIAHNKEFTESIFFQNPHQIVTCNEHVLKIHDKSKLIFQKIQPCPKIIDQIDNLIYLATIQKFNGIEIVSLSCIDLITKKELWTKQHTTNAFSQIRLHVGPDAIYLMIHSDEQDALKFYAYDHTGSELFFRIFNVDFSDWIINKENIYLLGYDKSPLPHPQLFSIDLKDNFVVNEYDLGLSLSSKERRDIFKLYQSSDQKKLVITNTENVALALDIESKNILWSIGLGENYTESGSTPQPFETDGIIHILTSRQGNIYENENEIVYDISTDHLPQTICWVLGQLLEQKINDDDIIVPFAKSEFMIADQRITTDDQGYFFVQVKGFGQYPILIPGLYWFTCEDEGDCTASDGTPLVSQDYITLGETCSSDIMKIVVYWHDPDAQE